MASRAPYVQTTEANKLDLARLSDAVQATGIGDDEYIPRVAAMLAGTVDDVEPELNKPAARRQALDPKKLEKHSALLSAMEAGSVTLVDTESVSLRKPVPPQLTPFTSETARKAAQRSAEVRSGRAAERRLTAGDRARAEVETDAEAIYANLRRIAAGRDEYAKASEQIAAARLLFERAYGKAETYHEAQDVEAVDLAGMSEADMRTYLLGVGVDPTTLG